jgi:hypothetical protein
MFTTLLLEKGFSVDPRIIDPSRVMRLPYTLNYKELDQKLDKTEPKVFNAYILNDTNNRYDILEVIEKIKKLESINEVKNKIIQTRKIDFKEEKADTQLF